MVIATRQQSRPGGTAKGRGMKSSVLQTPIRQFLHLWRRRRPTKRGTHAEPDIVQQDQ